MRLYELGLRQRCKQKHHRQRVIQVAQRLHKRRIALLRNKNRKTASVTLRFTETRERATYFDHVVEVVDGLLRLEGLDVVHLATPVILANALAVCLREIDANRELDGAKSSA